MAQPILPGATIGVFGSGQLGRMFSLAARSMGYRIHTFSPDQDSPTGQVADVEYSASYDDLDAVRNFVRNVDALTFEFENISSCVADVADDHGVVVRPGGWVLHTAQHRIREKDFLQGAGLPVTPFAPIVSPEDLSTAAAQLGFPAVLKSAAFGYDGKSQAIVGNAAELEDAWASLGQQDAILERLVDFHAEISVVAARSIHGDIADFGAIENIHRNHILDLSIAPARIPPVAAAEAVECAGAVLESLDVVGVMCVEFFLTKEDRLLINEIAPRPHNSGHLTIEAAVTSQFEQQVRAICGLPLGNAQRLRPAAMANLLGDLWLEGAPDWPTALSHLDVNLHLYGKRDARVGRKMGHLTATDANVELALAKVKTARCVLASESKA